MTTLAEKLNALPEERRRRIEALAEEFRVEEQDWQRTNAQEPSAIPSQPLPSCRTEQQQALLKEALARPGMREMMQVYGNWQAADRAQAPFREALLDRPVVIATDHANIDPS